MPKIIDNPKEEILKQARDIVVTEGYDQLTMRNVSKRSGIAVGTIYNYFPTKQHLSIKLMENYWYDYLIAVEEIDKKEINLFQKLLEIYEKLETFVETFKEVWVKNSSTKYSQEGLARKKNFVEKLNKKLETILLKEEQKGNIRLFLDAGKLSEFLILNFIMMAQMKQFQYNDFEKIIKKLLI